MNCSSSQKAGLLLSASLFVLATPGIAEQVDTAAAPAVSGLEEIVVTARRRTESLLNVPVAVSALSSSQLERAHVSDATQIAEMTPNVMIAPAVSNASIAIRGVGSSYADAGIEQSVGINIDGVAAGRGRIILASQFDLQQVEVLKGPQALFFGKNSPAGVISISTADPTSTLSGMGRAGYETEARERFAEGFVSGPITDQLLFRFAAKVSKMDGWIKDVTKPGPNLAFPGLQIPGAGFGRKPGTTSYAGRITLKWQPSTDFSATLKFMANRQNGNGDDATEAFCKGGALAGGLLGTRSLGIGQVVYDPQSDCRLNQRAASGAIPVELRANWPAALRHDGKLWNTNEAYLGSLNMNYKLGDITLTSVTGFTKMFGRNLTNGDLTSFAIVMSAPTERSRTWSQEFRLASDFEGPLNFTLGSYYETARRSNTYNPILGFVGLDATNGGSAYTFDNIWRNSGKTYSAFGQLRWKILDGLELSGGARYTKEKKKAAGQNLYVNGLGPAFGLAPVGLVVRQNTKFSNWSPEVTLSYKPVRNVMTYVAYKTGYKSGGLSTPATISRAYVANPGLLAFRPEQSKGFEGGIKGELFDRTVRLDLSVYRYTFSDLQLTSLNPALVAYFVQNAGKARTTGVEGSLVWRATPELTLNSSASYNNAKFVDFRTAQCYTARACPAGASYDRTGQRLPRAPKYTFNAGADYHTNISSSLKAGIGGDAVYTSSFGTHETGDPAGVVESFWRLNANVRIAATDDKWELALIGRNLTNHYYFQISSDKVLSPAGQYVAYTVRPRQIVLQATVKF